MGFCVGVYKLYPYLYRADIQTLHKPPSDVPIIALNPDNSLQL